MIACVKCRREMRCEFNGMLLVFGTAHVYPGDRYKCPECGVEIVRAINSHHDPEALNKPHIVRMQDKNRELQDSTGDQGGG